MGLGSWRKKGGASAPPFLSGIGRRLLANLQRRREVDPSVPSHATQVELPDGSVVRAQFVGSQPIVTIEPGAASTASTCSIFVESGLLDLGTNTAANATDQPTFSDATATIYNGTDELSGPGKPNGRATVFVRDRKYRVGHNSLFDGTPDSVVSSALAASDRGGLEVTSNEKRACQGRLQPSLWTGLMQKWVAAQYGAPGASYRCTVAGGWPYLTTADETFISYRWVDGTWGLIDIGNFTYFFVVVYENEIYFATATLTECASKLREAMRTMPDNELRDRLETYVLAGMRIGEFIEVLEFPTPVEGTPFGPYGWKFNKRGTEFSIVTFIESDDLSVAPNQTRLWTRRLTKIGDTVFLSEHDEDAEDYLMGRDLLPVSAIAYASPSNRNVFVYNFELGFTFDLADHDAPIYCYYLHDDTLEVVRWSFTVSSVTPQIDKSVCWDYEIRLGYCADTPELCKYAETVDAYAVSAGFYTGRFTSVRLFKLGMGEFSPELRHYVAASQQFDSVGTVGAPSSQDSSTRCDELRTEGDCGPAGPAGCQYESAASGPEELYEFNTDESLCVPPDGYTGCVFDEVIMETAFSDECLHRFRNYYLEGVEHSSFNLSRYDVRGGGLIVPCGSASGVFVRSRDYVLDIQLRTHYGPYNYRDETGFSYYDTEEVVSWTRDQRCFYVCDDTIGRPSTFSTVNVTGNMSERIVLKSVYTPADGADSVAYRSETFTESLTTHWLGPKSVTQLAEHEGEGVWEGDTVTSPACGFTMPAALSSTHNPLMTYGFTASEFELLEDDQGLGLLRITGRYPMFAITSVGGASAYFNDHLSMQRTHPDLSLTYDSGYPTVTYPSFIGWT